VSNRKGNRFLGHPVSAE